jgi:hypothetical protein
MPAPRRRAQDAIPVASGEPGKWLPGAVFWFGQRFGRRCPSGPSGGVRSLRTHVPFVADIRTRTARARRVPAHPLVPHARGRRLRRLGGRLERASRRSSMPGAAARGSRPQAAATAGSTPARAAGLRHAFESRCCAGARHASASWLRQGACWVAPAVRARLCWRWRRCRGWTWRSVAHRTRGALDDASDRAATVSGALASGRRSLAVSSVLGQTSARKKNGPPRGRPVNKKPAASYSPRPFRAKYHRR